jgi:hypothetical protein
MQIKIVCERPPHEGEISFILPREGESRRRRQGVAHTQPESREFLQMSKRLADTAEEFAARLAWSWIELQSIIQTQNNIGRPDPQSDTV